MKMIYGNKDIVAADTLNWKKELISFNYFSDICTYSEKYSEEIRANDYRVLRIVCTLVVKIFFQGKHK